MSSPPCKMAGMPNLTTDYAMRFYHEHRGFEVHLGETPRTAEAGDVAWMVRGYGKERANGVASSRQDAFLAACAAIDQIEDDPHRFPINLVGYPQESEGDVVTQDGEVLGRWRMGDNESLETAQFIPEGADEVLFEDHFIGMLCATIRDWHEEREAH